MFNLAVKPKELFPIPKMIESTRRLTENQLFPEIPWFQLLNCEDLLILCDSKSEYHWGLDC